MTINGLTGSVPSVGVPTTLLEEYTDYGGGGEQLEWLPFGPGLSLGAHAVAGRGVSLRGPESNVAASMDDDDDDDVPFFGGGGGPPLRPETSSLFLDIGGGHGTGPLTPLGGGHFDPPPWGMPTPGVPGQNAVPGGPARGPGGGHFDPGLWFSRPDRWFGRVKSKRVRRGRLVKKFADWLRKRIKYHRDMAKMLRDRLPAAPQSPTPVTPEQPVDIERKRLDLLILRTDFKLSQVDSEAAILTMTLLLTSIPEQSWMKILKSYFDEFLSCRSFLSDVMSRVAGALFAWGHYDESAEIARRLEGVKGSEKEHRWPQDFPTDNR